MFEFLKKLAAARRACPDCGGRGRWQTQTLGSDGMVEIDTHYCESCQGRGIKTDDDQIDDFDLAGVGATEFDDDED